MQLGGEGLDEGGRLEKSNACGHMSKLRFDRQGLIPAIIQDEQSGDVLTLCYMNEEALKKTIEIGKVHVWRRSLGKLMMKGETSGCVQVVKKMSVDCENNSLLIKVDQIGVACHRGEKTCYYRELEK